MIQEMKVYPRNAKGIPFAMAVNIGVHHWMVNQLSNELINPVMLVAAACAMSVPHGTC